MTVTGICGSDIHAVHGRHPFVSLPYHPGHEVVGVVESTGDEVTTVAPGHRVTIEPTLPCGRCKMCTTERSNLCENLQFFGCGWNQGGMADYFTIPADRLHRVPDDLDDVTAVLIEPLSTPVHAVRLAGGVAGKSVAILGAGPIGLLLLAVVRAHGAKRVVVTDVLPAKREHALSLGADDCGRCSSRGCRRSHPPQPRRKRRRRLRLRRRPAHHHPGHQPSPAKAAPSSWSECPHVK